MISLMSRLSRLPVAESAILAAIIIGAAASRPAAADAPILRIEAGGPTARVQQVLFTPDGARLISVGWDKTVRIWSVDEARQIGTLRSAIGAGPEGRLYAAAISSDPALPLLAVAGDDLPQPVAGKRAAGRNSIRIFNLSTGHLTVLPGHPNIVSALAFYSRGTRLASASYDGSVQLWDARTGNPLQTLKVGDRHPVTAIAISPDDTALVSCSYNQDTGKEDPARLWDLNTGKPLRSLKCAGQVAAWTQGAIAIGSQDGHVHLCDAATGADQQVIDQGAAVMTLAFSPDGRQLLSGSDLDPAGKALVHVWSVPGGQPVQSFAEHQTTIGSVAFSSATLAASADGDGVIYLWNPATGAVQARLSGRGSGVTAVAWSADGNTLSWGNDRILKDVLPQARRVQHTFDLSQGVVGPDLDAAAPGDAHWQAAITDRGGQSLARSPQNPGELDVQEGGKTTRRIQLQDPSDTVECFSFTPDGSVVVGSDFGLAEYDVSRGNIIRDPMRTFIGHDSTVRAVAVSPDGRRLASASADQTVRIWSLDPAEAPRGAAIEPLLSIFRDHDAQWVVWHPTGYYNTSPTGDSLIGWQVNNGPNQIASFYSADQFRKLYYRPDVIKLLLATGNISGAVQSADADLARQKPVLPSAPMIAQVTAAGSGGALSGVTDEALVDVKAQVTDPEGRRVLKVSIFANGQEVAADNSSVPDQNGNWGQRVALNPGENNLVLRAVNDAGVQTEVPLKLMYHVPPPPEIKLLSPADGSAVPRAEAEIRAQITDPENHSFKVTLTANTREISAPALLAASAADGANFIARVPLMEGANTITIRAVNIGGVEKTAQLTLNCHIPAPPPPAPIRPPTITAVSVPDGSAVSTALVPIAIRVEDPDGHKLQISLFVKNGASVREMGAGSFLPAPDAAGRNWTGQAALAEGDNSIIIRAVNDAGAAQEAVIHLTYQAPKPPQIQLLPVPDHTENAVLPIRAMITDPANRKIDHITLLVNGKAIPTTNALMAPDKDQSNWGQSATLTDGDNILVVRAMNDLGVQAEQSIHVTFTRPAPPPVQQIRMVEPPHVFFLSPKNHQTVKTGQIKVSAYVFDPHGDKDATVTLLVNGRSEEEGRPIELPDKGIEQVDKGIELAEKGIELPEKGIELSDKGIELTDKGIELTDKGIELAEKGIELTDKGIELADKGSDAGNGDSLTGGVWERMVNLEDGDNEITIIVTGRDGTTARSRISVHYDGLANRKPDLYILAIGVSHYQHPDIHTLTFPDKDALDFATAWKDQQGKRFQNVEYDLLPNEKATKEGIQNGLDWLAQQVKPGDCAIIFASGHGACDPEHKHYYFACCDFDREAAAKTGVDPDMFYGTLLRLKQKKPRACMLFLDACNSGLATSTSDAYTQFFQGPHSGIVTFASSASDENSFEHQEWGNSAFTKAWVDELRGAGTQRNGKVELSRAIADVDDEIRTLTEGKQEPSTDKTGLNDDFVLAER